MSQSNNEIYIAADNSVTFVGLRAISEPREYINDADVSFSLYASLADAKAQANEISGADGIEMASTGSKGTYRGTLDDAVTATLSEGESYFLRVNIDAGDGRKDARFLEYTARLRGAA